MYQMQKTLKQKKYTNRKNKNKKRNNEIKEGVMLKINEYKYKEININIDEDVKDSSRNNANSASRYNCGFTGTSRNNNKLSIQ